MILAEGVEITQEEFDFIDDLNKPVVVSESKKPSPSQGVKAIKSEENTHPNTNRSGNYKIKETQSYMDNNRKSGFYNFK